MTWWLPVLYVCMANGQCSFAHGPVQVTKAECEKLLYGARDEMEAHPYVTEHDGACLEIKPGKTA